MKTIKYLITILSLFTLLSLVSCEEEVSFSQGGQVSLEGSNQIIVDIKGAVEFPGIYSVNEDALLIDVVKLAGGLLDIADVKNINFVTPVFNNQMIVIPTITTSNDQEKEDFLVNINTSNITELSILPGIGEVKAQSIIDYRNTNGRFTSIEQLRNVSGISESIYNKIKTMVTL